MSEGYFEITLIPSGSRHIFVEEMGPSKNYIGVGKADSKEFYLNGDRLISMSGEYEIAGAVGLYERDSEIEKLKIPGPIKEDISLYVSSKVPRLIENDVYLAICRLFLKESTKILAFASSIRCPRISPTTTLITGSCQTSRHAPRRAAAEFSRDFPSATNATRASSRRNCAGRMLRTKGSRKFHGHAMTSLALLIGGLAHGSLVR